MALIKDIENKSGVVIGYWKIISYMIEKDYLQGIAQIKMSLAGYLNKDARLANKDAVETKDFYMFPEDMPSEVEARPYLYAKLKTQTDFSGAIDDVE